MADLDFKTGHLDRKYKILNADETPVGPEAAFFVLRLDTDRHARKAALVYAAGAKAKAWSHETYKVEKAEGPTDPEAEYLALRVDDDKHARKALMAYAESVASENRIFALEICEWLWHMVPSADCGCREAGCGHMGPESWGLLAVHERIRRVWTG